MFHPTRYLIIATVALSLSGCVGYYKGEEAGRPTWHPEEGVPFELIRAPWALTINDELVQGNDKLVTVNISNDRIFGHAGCNTYSADFKMVAENAFEVSSPLATKMLCREISIEEFLLSNLRGVHRFSVIGDTLSIYSEEGADSPVMTFARLAPDAAVNSTDRTSE